MIYNYDKKRHRKLLTTEKGKEAKIDGRMKRRREERNGSERGRTLKRI